MNEVPSERPRGASARAVAVAGVAVVVIGVIARQARSGASGNWSTRTRVVTSTNNQACHVSQTSPAVMEGRYDIRRGTAAYAPITGAIGALAVPAIILLFTVQPKPTVQHAPFIALAAGLLIVAMIASFTGAIGMAAIGAELDPTANLVPATLFLAIPVVVSIVTVLGAFEVLASIYLPASKTLFALIAAAAGISGVFFMAFAIGDCWQLGPTSDSERDRWLPTQWIQTKAQAYRWAQLVTLASIVPAASGMVIRIAGAGATPSSSSVDWLVGSALVLVLVGGFWGIFRTEHPLDGIQKGLRPYEAFGTTLAVSFYILFLMITLP